MEDIFMSKNMCRVFFLVLRKKQAPRWQDTAWMMDVFLKQNRKEHNLIL